MSKLCIGLCSKQDNTLACQPAMSMGRSIATGSFSQLYLVEENVKCACTRRYFGVKHLGMNELKISFAIMSEAF